MEFKVHSGPCLTQSQTLDPLGLSCFQLGPIPVLLRFAKPQISGKATPLLRLIIARDCRRTALIEAFIHGVRVGQVDVRIPAQWANFVIDLSSVLGNDPQHWPQVLELALRATDNPGGISRSIRASDPLPGIVVGSPESAPFSGWLGIPDHSQGWSEVRALADFLTSPANRDYLGWMIGCASTGLCDLYQASGEMGFLYSLKQLLSGYGEGLPLENPNLVHHLGSTPAEVLNSQLESFAPIAALAKLQRWEPGLERESILLGLGKQMSEVADTPQDSQTSEACFTLAFPLAATAKTLTKPGWADKAAELCLKRWDFLVRGDDIIQRAYQDGRTHMTNWARGTAWLLLGTSQTALELPSNHPALAKLADHFCQAARLMLSRQRPDGLWSVFTDNPASGAETSGSAGIATALALAAKLGWLNTGLDACQHCLKGLETFIQADGCLAGASQHNPAGEEALQLNYRIRSAWGTGLYAQLVAALKSS